MPSLAEDRPSQAVETSESSPTSSKMAPSTTPEKKEDPPKEENKPLKIEDMTDIIDKNTFDQILEMDDEDDHEFSQGIVFGFFEQAESTFEKMEKQLEEKNLEELANLGHFLKGSSATLGLNKVKDGCEKIQHFGHKKDETGTTDEPDDKVSLERIDKTLKDVKKDYKEVEKVLRRYYDEASEAQS